jgi:hypothetical protein
VEHKVPVLLPYKVLINGLLVLLVNVLQHLLNPLVVFEVIDSSLVKVVFLGLEHLQPLELLLELLLDALCYRCLHQLLDVLLLPGVSWKVDSQHLLLMEP